jgi:hypothetical protein
MIHISPKTIKYFSKKHSAQHTKFKTNKNSTLESIPKKSSIQSKQRSFFLSDGAKSKFQKVKSNYIPRGAEFLRPKFINHRKRRTRIEKQTKRTLERQRETRLVWSKEQEFRMQIGMNLIFGNRRRVGWNLIFGEQ